MTKPQTLERVNIIWSTDYYDGPLEGLCNLQGERLWFSTREDGGWRAIREGERCADCGRVGGVGGIPSLADEGDWNAEPGDQDPCADEVSHVVCDPRIYDAWRLTPAMLTEQDRRREAWVRIVWGGSDRQPKTLPPNWMDFYDLWPRLKTPEEQTAARTTLLEGAIHVGIFPRESSQTL